MPNWKQIYAKQKASEERIRKLVGHFEEDRTGIYMFKRINEYGVVSFYIGKAEKQSLLKRMAQHLTSYQHIDLSIRKYGLYDSVKNPYGYKAMILTYCEPELCNELERKMIQQCLEKGWVTKNVESGGTANKTDIEIRRASKGYREGVEYGYKKAIREIKVYFSKYLDYGIKGKPNKLKERKYNEFKEWLNEKGC